MNAPKIFPQAARHSPRDDKPLDGRTDEEILEILRLSGFHPPAKDVRFGSAAMTMRRDVTVGDAFESAVQALDQARGPLMMMECDADGPEYLSSSAAAVRALLDVAAAHLAVAGHGLLRVSSPHAPAAQALRGLLAELRRHPGAPPGVLLLADAAHRHADDLVCALGGRPDTVPSGA